MPIYRAPDGKIIEERTRKVSAEDMTRRAGVSPDIQESADEEKTRKIGSQAVPHAPAGAQAPVAKAADDERTRYVNLGNRDAGKVPDALSDPVVGWLAVVKGPGCGNLLSLGYGANIIGRADSNRVRLDFGDDLVSRSSHAVLTYDPRGRKFYIQQGSGAGLVYIDEQPVLTPREISANTRIVLGNTTLHFQPLCGEDFDWQDIQEQRD